ncbi:glutamate racemase [Candidatus Viridilinea mediisalina]|uniref:Glutamate racemase n=1 Tax=Candidatus Viridilinea mediisalina TaxID=2024553 RepID=A0A2A6RD00_9CHLR|nr:glutamate racemase [Candidatus Viridilinea mediisalina]PDV99145.1 glutamate racemase [Candidatus Viridilinea mediisalina]
MIGLFDSGLGGLSVVRALRAVLPQHDLLYVADTAYCPYGPLPQAEIQARANLATRWLIEQGAQLVVVACNTATAAAADRLRVQFRLPLVAMEPGVKPAVAATRSGRVAVLATQSTLRAERFAGLVQRFANGIHVQTVPCPHFVQLVEAGELHGSYAAAVVHEQIAPLVAAGVDTLVLGCTHFPPLRPLIAAAAPAATIIDTGPAVAAQTARLALAHAIAAGQGQLRCVTSGDPTAVAPALARVWGAAQAVEGIQL